MQAMWLNFSPLPSSRAAARTVFPWDIVATVLPGGAIFLDVRGEAGEGRGAIFLDVRGEAGEGRGDICLDVRGEAGEGWGRCFWLGAFHRASRTVLCADPLEFALHSVNETAPVPPPEQARAGRGLPGAPLLA